MDPDNIKPVKGTETQEHSLGGGLRAKGVTKRDALANPLVSIITVVLNNEDYILETINSVLNQTYDNIEFIIIDGGSTDGTLNIIRKFEERVDLWVSEPDKGIYDAMNKGIALATGSYLNFLNGDDHFTDIRVVEKVVKLLNNSKADIVYGDTLMLNKKNGYGYIRKGNVKKYYFLFKGIPQQVFFYRKHLFSSEKFDTKYKIAADLDFLLNAMIVKNATIKYVPWPIVVFNTGATSSNMKVVDEERNMIIRCYFTKLEICLFKNMFFRWMFVRNE